MIREKRNYTIMVFRTTSEAMAMERFCREENIPGRLIPVPREVSASCGLCWRMTDEEYQSCQKTLEDLKNSYDRTENVRM